MAPLEAANPLDLNGLNQVQWAALQELKRRFSGDPSVNLNRSFLQDEHYLIHWLKARKFDVSKAEAMLRNHLRYRNALKMDSPEYLHFKIHPVMTRYYTRGRYGFSKQGHPIVYFPFGGIDPKGLVSSVKMSDALKAVMAWQEERRKSCLEASKQLGKRIQQVVYILDLKGIGTRHLWPTGLEVFQQIAKMVEQHTPEIIYKVKVINAPNLFYAIFKIVKPILDENTLRKLQIFGTEGWKEALLEEIDKDQLPVYYGGSAVGIDGDIKCEHAIRYGGEIPKELYFTEEKKKKLLPPSTKLMEINVPRGQQLLLRYHADKPGCLFWYFESISAHDLGFAVYRIPNDSRTSSGKEDMVTFTRCTDVTGSYEMVNPYFRLLTHIIPEWGHVEVGQPGTYVLQFDNSYSWIYSKTIQYFVTVESRDSELLRSLPLSDNTDSV